MRVPLSFLKLISLTLIACCYSCNNTSPPVIEPINAELNSSLITGKDLAPGLFSTKNIMQYYQIDNTGGKTPEQLITFLQEFANEKYPVAGLARRDMVLIYFYRKRLFVNYDSHLYEYARDNETGAIDGHHDDLKALVAYYKHSERPNEFERHTTVYNKGEEQKTVIDTLTINR